MIEKQKIEDAGAVVPRAKKHLAQKKGEFRQKTSLLSTLWAKPDWIALVESGMSPEVAAKIYMIYEAIPSSPRTYSFGIESNEWESAYIAALPLFRDILLACKTLKEVDDSFHKLCHLYGFDSRNQRKPKIRNIYQPYSIGHGSHKSLKGPLSLTFRQQLLARSMHKLGWPHSDYCIKFNKVHTKLSNDKWVAGTISGQSISWKTGYYDKEEDAIQQTLKEINELKPIEGKGLAKKPVNNDIRSGENYRNGKDVTPEDLMSEFGLKGVQFGNSLLQNDRQEWVNQTFDALADLAYVIGFKRQWIGLGKKLSIAIGARGAGNAMAHFEPDLWVINLTRKRGAGSLAHEWGHALDCRLLNTVLPTHYNIERPFLSRCDYFEFQKLNEKQASIVSIYKTIGTVTKFNPELHVNQQTSFYQQAYKIQNIKGERKYWTEPYEMFARAFEAFMQDALTNMGRSSPWLVHGTLETDYSDRLAGACPYPIGAEREFLNKSFIDLLRILVQQ